MHKEQGRRKKKKQEVVSEELLGAGESGGVRRSEGARGPCPSALLCSRAGGSTEQRSGVDGWALGRHFTSGLSSSGPGLPLLPLSGACVGIPGGWQAAGGREHKQRAVAGSCSPLRSAPGRRKGGPAPAALRGGVEPRRGCEGRAAGRSPAAPA